MKKIIFIILVCFFIRNAVAQTWQPVGVGFLPNDVQGLYVYNNELYAGGGILTSGPTIVNGVSKWNGTYWDSLASGAYFGAPTCFVEYNNQLIAAGTFMRMIGFPDTKGIAAWDGTNWNALGHGITQGFVKAMAVYNGSLYVGGTIQVVDNNLLITDVARWDGTMWHAVATMSGGLSQVESMAVYNGELYVGGYFSSIDSVPAQNIIKFDGTTWTEVGGGVNSDVLNMAVDTTNNILYIGGFFNYATSGTIVCPSNIAYWDGNEWTPVGSNGPNLNPWSLCIYNNQLYAGFTYPPYVTNQSGDTLRLICRWNGTDWENVGGGVNDAVLAMSVFNDKLIVGGNFTTATGQLVNHVASWTDTTTTGLQNISTTQSKLYPNPTNQTQVYYTNTLAANQTGHLQVTDMLGNILATYNLNNGSNKITINTAAYAKGVYVVKVNVEGMVGESLKMVVE